MLYLQAKWLNLFPDVGTQMKETTTIIRIWEVCWSWIDCSKLKVTKSGIWFIASNVVLYLLKESVVCSPCFSRQKYKNTENYFTVIFDMNGIQLEKYLWANAESPITVSLFQLANIKIRSSSPWPLSKSKNCSPFSDSWHSRGIRGISGLISGLGGWCLPFVWCRFSSRKICHGCFWYTC